MTHLSFPGLWWPEAHEPGADHQAADVLDSADASSEPGVRVPDQPRDDQPDPATVVGGLAGRFDDGKDSYIADDRVMLDRTGPEDDS